MISNIKGFDETALIESESHRKFLESFESDLLRGIGKICVLRIIKKYGDKGVHGYQLLKDLKDETSNMLVIKEGTLYPLLRNLEDWSSKGTQLSLIQSKTIKDDKRPRKYYYLTEEGKKILSHLEGFFSKLLEAIAELNEFTIVLNEEKYMFCPNCKNKIDHLDNSVSYCEVCGFNFRVSDEEN